MKLKMHFQKFICMIIAFSIFSFSLVLADSSSTITISNPNYFSRILNSILGTYKQISPPSSNYLNQTTYTYKPLSSSQNNSGLSGILSSMFGAGVNFNGNSTQKNSTPPPTSNQNITNEKYQPAEPLNSKVQTSSLTPTQKDILEKISPQPSSKSDSRTVYFVDCGDTSVTAITAPQGINAGKIKNVKKGDDVSELERAGSLSTESPNPRICVSKSNLLYATMESIPGKNSFVVIFDKTKINSNGLSASKCAIFPPGSIDRIIHATGYVDANCSSFLNKDISTEIKNLNIPVYFVKSGFNVASK